MLDAHTRQFWRRALDPIGRGLARIGITANGLTAAGLVITAAAAWLVATDRPVLGGWVLLAGSLADTFDGPVARASDTASVAGGFYDSVADRTSDALILFAVVWSVRDDAVLFSLAAVALVAAQLTSYVRAKAESLGASCAVGLFERAERAIALMIGLVFHRWLFTAVLWLLALGGTATVVQRIVHVAPELGAQESASGAGTGPAPDQVSPAESSGAGAPPATRPTGEEL